MKSFWPLVMISAVQFVSRSWCKLKDSSHSYWESGIVCMASTKVLDICTRSKDGEQSWDGYVTIVLDIVSALETQR